MTQAEEKKKIKAKMKALLPKAQLKVVKTRTKADKANKLWERAWLKVEAAKTPQTLDQAWRPAERKLEALADAEVKAEDAEMKVDTIEAAIESGEELGEEVLED